MTLAGRKRTLARRSMSMLSASRAAGMPEQPFNGLRLLEKARRSYRRVSLITAGQGRAHFRAHADYRAISPAPGWPRRQSPRQRASTLATRPADDGLHQFRYFAMQAEIILMPTPLHTPFSCFIRHRYRHDALDRRHSASRLLHAISRPALESPFRHFQFTPSMSAREASLTPMPRCDSLRHASRFSTLAGRVAATRSFFG